MSLSSDAPIDTSDELMDVHCDKFIAGCEAEARLSKSQGRADPEDQRVSDDHRTRGEQLIRNLEENRTQVYISQSNLL